MEGIHTLIYPWKNEDIMAISRPEERLLCRANKRATQEIPMVQVKKRDIPIQLLPFGLSCASWVLPILPRQQQF